MTKEKPPVLSSVYSREEINESLNKLLRDESFVNDYLRSELVAILKLVRQETAREIFEEIEKHPEQCIFLIDVHNPNKWWQAFKSKYLGEPQ